MLSIIYGTRPEYLKILPIILLLQKDSTIPYSVIRILQHENLDETDLLYDTKLEIISNSENRLDTLGSQILEKLGPFIQTSKYVLVQGDTSAAFYAALSAFQNMVKVIHLEAGLRTYNIENPYPEEGYRQMISRITSIHLTPNEVNLDLLRKEKVFGEIYTVGNTILDLVKSYNLDVREGNSILITFHRRENYKYLEVFIERLSECMNIYTDKVFYWILHPNKNLQATVKELVSKYKCKVTFIEPCSHKEFLDLARVCFCILTDSGGIQEEASFLGKCSIVLRSDTEREQIPFPYIQLCRPPYSNIIELIKNIPSKVLTQCLIYGNGNSALKIIDIIKKIIIEKNKMHYTNNF
jgi:UDP-N-acetylglucosamine 2-epimerase (non-hydrolysing)